MVSLPEHSLRSVCMMNFWERVSESESIKQNGIRQWRGPRWMMYGKIDTLFGSIISLISIELTYNPRAPSRTGGRFLWAWAFEHRRRLFCLSRSLFRLFAARPPFCSMLCVAPDQKSSSSRGTEKIQMLWVLVKLSFGARLCKSRNEIYFIWWKLCQCAEAERRVNVVCVSGGKIQPIYESTADDITQMKRRKGEKNAKQQWKIVYYAQISRWWARKSADWGWNLSLSWGLKSWE